MLTPADIFKALALLGNILSFVYLAVFLLSLWATWKFVGKTMADHKQRCLLQSAACLAVTALFMIPVGKDYMERQTYIREQQAKRDEFQARYNKAKAIFDERCKTAGEKIYHTVEGVEGITLLNVPQEYRHEFGSDPMWEGAGLPSAHDGESYIKDFLKFEVRNPDGNPYKRWLDFRHLKLGNKGIVYYGYQYVDVKRDNGSYLRYETKLINKNNSNYDSIIIRQIKDKSSRYAVEYHPIVNSIDRKYWVAGLTINIYDTNTNSLMASKTWYSIEPGLGNSNQRIPWYFAQICPSFEEDERDIIALFVYQVVKPKQGD